MDGSDLLGFFRDFTGCLPRLPREATLVAPLVVTNDLLPAQAIKPFCEGEPAAPEGGRTARWGWSPLTTCDNAAGSL